MANLNLKVANKKLNWTYLKVSLIYLNLIDIIFASKFFTNFNFFFFFNQTFIDNCESYTIDEINEIRSKWATYIQQFGVLEDDEDDEEQYFSLLLCFNVNIFCLEIFLKH